MNLGTREVGILTMLADGASSVEMAEEFALTRGSLDVVVARLLNRMGARNRPHAVGLAYHWGVLEPMVQR